LALLCGCTLRALRLRGLRVQWLEQKQTGEEQTSVDARHHYSGNSATNNATSPRHETITAVAMATDRSDGPYSSFIRFVFRR
jgi:hypothetical protein